VIRNGGVIGKKIEPTTSSAVGIWDCHDNSLYHREGTFPNLGRVDSVVINGSGSNQSIAEGTQITCAIQTLGMIDGQTVSYEVVSVTGTVSAADFSGGLNSLTGTATVSSNSATVTGALVPSDGSETESFKIRVKPSNGGDDLFVDSPTITITDTVGENLVSNYYQIAANRFLQSSSTSDTANNWDVAQVQIANAGSYRIYMVAKVTASTTYYNDVCVAAVQVIRSNSVAYNYIFTNNNSSNSRSWTYSTRVNGSSSLGVPSTYALTNVNSLSFSSITTGTDKNRWNNATGTGSHYTGMADGISHNITGSLTVGALQVPQNAGNYYIYAETSGTSRYSCVICRSPLITFQSGDYIKVCTGIVTANSMSSSHNINDTLWIGLA
tara:strand:+ start:3096 stop:4241 length:1146 start_codon:yes stop_codon:yes gene_type:complete